MKDITDRLGLQSVPHFVEGNALEAIEKIVLELDADAVTLGRRDGDSGASMLSTYLAERVFCRLNRSLLLITSERGMRSEISRSRWMRN